MARNLRKTAWGHAEAAAETPTEPQKLLAVCSPRLISVKRVRTFSREQPSFVGVLLQEIREEDSQDERRPYFPSSSFSFAAAFSFFGSSSSDFR